jgi:hypothetical protein
MIYAIDVLKLPFAGIGFSVVAEARSCPTSSATHYRECNSASPIALLLTAS